MQDLYDRYVGLVGTAAQIDPTLSVEDIAKAAAEFERILNSAAMGLKVELTSLDYSTTSTSKVIYKIRIFRNDQVYP